MWLYIQSHTVSHGLSQSCAVSHGLSRSCTIANTIIHGHGTDIGLVWFDSLFLSQQLWSCWDGQFSSPDHTFSWASLTKCI